MAIILAGGEGERLSILSQERAKPAVPFGGKYRIIDFTLSNCVNSDIHDVVVLTQYNPRSLNDHIGLGRPWDLDRNQGGVKLLQPYIARGKVAEWYRGTADAVLRNMNVIEHDPSDTVVVLAGDHIYKMDYQPFIAAHRRRRADVTIAVRRVPLAEASRMGILALDENDRVIEWQEKPKQPKSDLASMGVYVFSKKTLRRWLSEDRVDFGRHVIPAMLEADARVFGYRYNGYWQDVGTIQSFWEANMALLEDDPELDLYDKDWVIHTRSEERAPAKVGPDGPGPSKPHQPRLRDQRDGRQLGPVAGRAGRCRRRRPRLDRDVRLGHPLGRGRRPLDPRQGGRGRAGRDRRDRAVRRSSRTSRSRPASTPASPSSASGRSSRAVRASAGTCSVAADIRTSDFVKKVIKSGESVDRRAGGRAPHDHGRAAEVREERQRARAEAPAVGGRTVPVAGTASGSRTPGRVADDREAAERALAPATLVACSPA